MTIIAFKDGVMAADTQLTSFNARLKAQKIVRLKDGGVAGACGLWANAYSCLKWLEDGNDPHDAAALAREKDWMPSVKDASVLIARPDGSLWLLEDEFPPFPIMDTAAAIGCGSDAAMMAMSLGLSAVEAVAKVTKQDVMCGDPVQSMEVEETHEYAGPVTHAPKRKARKAK